MKKLRKIILISSIIISILIVLNFSAGLIVVNAVFSTGRNSESYQNVGLYTYEEIKNDYPREEITYKGNQGSLQGYYFGKNNTDKLVIFSHGIYDYADTLLAQQLYFLDNGFNVFSYDSSGCGKSEGKMSGFSQSLIDLKYTLDYLNQTPKFAIYKKVLFGFSWGGYAASSILNINPKNVYATASLSGYNNAETLLYEMGFSKINFIAALGKPAIDLYQNYLFSDYLEYTGYSGIINSQINTYIIHSKNDGTVLYDTSIAKAFEGKKLPSNVKLYVEEKFDNEAINRHLYLQHTIESSKYQMDIKNKYSKLSNEDEKKAFYQMIDKKLYNQLNLELFDSILEFYNYSLK